MVKFKQYCVLLQIFTMYILVSHGLVRKMTGSVLNTADALTGHIGSKVLNKVDDQVGYAGSKILMRIDNFREPFSE